MTEPGAQQTREQTERDFEFFMRRAGLSVSEARRKGAIAVYEDLIKSAALLHAPRDASAWGANVFVVDTVVRAKGDPT